MNEATRFVEDTGISVIQEFAELQSTHELHVYLFDKFEFLSSKLVFARFE